MILIPQSRPRRGRFVATACIQMDPTQNAQAGIAAADFDLRMKMLRFSCGARVPGYPATIANPDRAKRSQSAGLMVRRRRATDLANKQLQEALSADQTAGLGDFG